MSLFVKSHLHKRYLGDDDVLNGVILNMDTSDHITVKMEIGCGLYCRSHHSLYSCTYLIMICYGVASKLN